MPKPPEPIASPLERYITVLETIAPFEDGLTAAELETALALPKTTINRLLHALMASGMVRSTNMRNRTYRLGDRLLGLLQSWPDDSWIAPLSQRLLQTLADETGQSAFISRFDGAEVRSVTCVAPDSPVRTYVMPGMSMPLNATASAKAILAFHADDVVRGLLSADHRSFTDRTITDFDRLSRELDLVRARGYATDLAEHVPGLGSIAFPVRPADGEIVYAIGLTGPYGQVIDQDFDKHCDALSRAALELGKLLRARLRQQ